MAGRTHRGVLPPQGRRIESGTVGVEPPSPRAEWQVRQSRSEWQETQLSRFCRAAWPWPRRNDRLASWYPALQPSGGEPGAHVTVGAELRGCGNRRRLVSRVYAAAGWRGEESGRMVARASHRPRRAGGSRDTADRAWQPLQVCGRRRASRRAARKSRCRVRRGAPVNRAPRPRPGPAAGMASAAVGCRRGTPGSSPGYDRWRTAPPPSGRRLRAAGRNAGIRVARWRLELRLDGQGARIGRERLDGGHLRRVDVAFGAEVPRVAGGA